MAGDGSSKGAVLAALMANTGLTVLKFAAFAVTGSGTMFSEAMHTLADTANQGLLFIGIKRSERKPDALFTYGYGGERFLYALLSAVGIFVLGCGVTVYHGVSSLLHPHPVQIKWWLFLILGISFVVNGYVLLMAIKAINQQRGEQSFMEFLKTTNDPTIAAVLLEDGIACGGVMIAVVCIALSALLKSPVPDSVGSIIIGGLLGVVAIWLGYQNRSLILGRAVRQEVQDLVVGYLKQQPSIDRVRGIQSRIIGADTYKIKAEIDWNGRWFGELQVEWLEDNKGKLGADVKDFAGEFGERITEAVALEIDRIEVALREQVPELKFIDLEGDATGMPTKMEGGEVAP
ncbi:MAG: cation diffusion facilitator family transporter [Planctomycetes bacterium]|nr:cation diffusion facilitator family transporter [Planctomycetota bacterium]